MRVPTGSSFVFNNTTALPSKRIREPSARRTPCAVRTTTASYTIAKKHVKPNPNAGVTGGIVDTEMPVAISNVAIYNAKTKKADRVGLRIDKDGNKERFFKSNGDSIV
jgi:ribosomal protein L24